jgi:trimethylamine---corrinoid protein Co-methyltransferase
MSEAPQTETPRIRRRAGGTGSRERVSAIAPLGRVTNPWKPVEIFSHEQVAQLIAGAHHVLTNFGMEIRSKAALDIFAKYGAVVDFDTRMVRLPQEVIAHYRAFAPENFVLRARNPAQNLHIGGNVLNFGPVGGAPNVSDQERGRRYGDFAAFQDILKLNHSLGALHWQGGVVVEPVDIPVPIRHLHMNMAHIQCSDQLWQARGVGGIAAQDSLAMSAIEHQCSIEKLAAKPSLMIVTNVNSPRRLDEEILDSIMLMAKYGQCVCITPFTLMGAMAPITLAGALVQQTAEALAVIVLCQMIRAGTPCIMGGFTSNVDMRTGSPAFGTPENVHATLGGAQLARALKLPYRSSAVNASPVVDAQSTYETGFSLWAAIMSHSNLITHAAGWLEGGLVNSFEKIVVDAEMLRGWADMLKPAQFNADDLALEAIGAIAPGGHFFGSDHTKARYETAFYRPILSDWSNFENWQEHGAKDATTRAHEVWKKAIAIYQAPPLDDAIRDELRDFVARRTRDLMP